MNEMTSITERVAIAEGKGTAKTRAVVIGATGYSGAELATILGRHPHVAVTGLFGSDFTFDALAEAAPDVVFLAVPNEVSAHLAPKLLEAGMRVIDLSGAFRLRDGSLYPKWYGFEHEKPALLEEAVYGLTEWCNGELKKAQLVANPGCYPTSVLLALRPIMYLIDRDQAVI